MKIGTRSMAQIAAVLGKNEESGFQDPAMNSFNHYAYGSIGAWLYSVIYSSGRSLSHPTQPRRRICR